MFATILNYDVLVTLSKYLGMLVGGVIGEVLFGRTKNSKNPPFTINFLYFWYSLGILRF